MIIIRSKVGLSQQSQFRKIGKCRRITGRGELGLGPFFCIGHTILIPIVIVIHIDRCGWFVLSKHKFVGQCPTTQCTDIIRIRIDPYLIRRRCVLLGR